MGVFSMRDLKECRSPTGRPGQGGNVKAKGFSLVELMVTVAVLAIVSAIAIPNFTSMINSNRLVSQANELVGVVQGARSEAIRYNQRVYVCSSSNGTTCSGSGTWNGWLVFLDRNRDAAPQSAEILQRGTVRAPLQLTSALGNGTFHFRPDGYARGASDALLATSFRVCMATNKPAENIRNIAISSGSRLTTTKANGGGTCS